MTWYQTRDCDGKCLAHVHRNPSLCGTLHRTRAGREKEEISSVQTALFFRSKLRREGGGGKGGGRRERKEVRQRS